MDRINSASFINFGVECGKQKICKFFCIFLKILHTSSEKKLYTFQMK